MASYSWLSEFDLLKYSHTDIMQKPWSVPVNREVADKYFKVVCAHEEIHHLNVEICRLDTWIMHEDNVFKSAIDTATNPHIAVELRCCYAEQWHMNHLHCIHISAIYHLDRYSGPGPFVPESEKPLENQFGNEEVLIDGDDDVEEEVLWLLCETRTMAIYNGKQISNSRDKPHF